MGASFIFDKSAKKVMFDLMNVLVTNKRCPFCKKTVWFNDFGGGAHIDGLPRMFCESLPCLLEFADYVKKTDEKTP